MDTLWFISVWCLLALAEGGAIQLQPEDQTVAGALPYPNPSDILRVAEGGAIQLQPKDQTVAGALPYPNPSDILRVAEGGATQLQPKDQTVAKALPCPNPSDILPCVCTVAEDHVTMDMDCSAVQDEYQLADVFKAHLPFTAFRRLTIEGNKSLKRIRQGDLGPATFQEIYIRNGVLVEIENNFLDWGNYFTLTRLRLSQNQLNTFPFQDLYWVFNALEYFDISYNNIIEIPELLAYSLKTLYIYNNPLKGVTASTFKRLQNIEVISLFGSNIEIIEPGTFVGLPHLRSIDLHGMKLTTIPAGAITLTSDRPTDIYLNNNNISTVEPGAISGTNVGNIFFHFNQLTDLDETVFRPIFDAGTSVHLAGNPLSCGCDLAWFITNPEYMKLLDDYPDFYATCSSGDKLQDLDPNLYLNLC